jgi:hypothetical protein
MNWDALGAIGEIIGASAVLITLVYLALQIRENTRSIHSESRGRISAQSQAFSAVIGGSREVASVFKRGLADLNSLDAEDQIQFSFLFSMIVNHAHDSHHEHLLGVRDREAQLAHASAVLSCYERPEGVSGGAIIPHLSARHFRIW